MVEHLLLIEDFEPDAVIVRRMLSYTRLGQPAVTWCRSLAEGIATLSGGTFDLILLNTRLPDGKGLALIRAVHRAAPDTPIIVLTGMASFRHAVDSVPLGVHDFLFKDRLDPEALEASIRLALARGELARALRDASERERLLRELIASIASASRFDEVLDAAVDGIWRVFPVDRVRVHWYHRGPRGPELVLAPGADDDASDVIDAGTLGFLSRVDAILGDDGGEVGWLQVEGYRVLPVGELDQRHGVLCLRPRSDAAWTGELDALLDALSQAVCAAVDRALEAEALRRSLLAHSKMSAYLPQGVAQDILARPEADHGATGRRLEAVVLLVDIVGFTRWAETRDPRLVVDVLNGWFEVVDDILSRHGAILDKHMGDAVMAVFRPSNGLRDARRDLVLRAAAACSEVMRAFSPDLDEQPFRVHLAASLGPVLLGPVGSRHRTEYTVIGDTVNVTSRLGNLPTEGGLMVNAAFREALGPDSLRRLGLQEIHRSAHRLRGREALMDVYDLGLAGARASTPRVLVDPGSLRRSG